MRVRFWFVAGILLTATCSHLSAAQKIALYGKRSEGTAAGNALRVLESALRGEGLPFHWIDSVQEQEVDETLLSFDSGLPRGPESFSIRKRSEGGRNVISIAGGDDTGLAYGVFELLGQMAAARRPLNLFQILTDTAGAPQVRVRSLAMLLSNRDLEREWFFLKEFWNSYFQLLATSRFNQFTLIYGQQSPYLAPLFAFMLDVPGYERLKTPGYTDDDRRQNLATLRMVSELASQWGIRFVLGIWQEHAYLYGKNMVEGLSYKDLVDYCPKAMAILLKECPRIQGVQLRMNHESGILEEDQKEFFTGMAKAIRSAGRPISVDFRAKGLTPETIASAQSFGIRPIVSTKYWREHMGLPFHETMIDPADRQRGDHRYGFWDLIPRDRTYDVSYQFWTFGTQKILLWGSLDYARQFAESTHLGDAIGYEVFAPLSERGFGNWPGGAWHLFVDRRMEYYRWEFERYWDFYMTLGLAGYSADGPHPIIDGEFQKRFGGASASMREAYTAASWVLPFLTSVRAPSASSFGYWPEMDTDGLTDRYIALDTGDDNLFYRIDDYVKDYLGRKFSARMTPEDMASRLDNWATTVRSALERAEPALPAKSDRKEFSSTKIDFGALAELARYHAERFRSAQEYQFFVRTGERQCLLDAIRHYRDAVERWAALGRLTDGVYYDHMVFNKPPEQVGHWKDELPFLKVDLARLEEIDRVLVENYEHPKSAEKWQIENPQSKMIMQWKEQNGVISRWADTSLKPTAAEDFPDRYAMRHPRLVIKTLFNDFRYSKILHKPVHYMDAGAPLNVHASILGSRKGVPMTLHYRLAGQGFHFDSVEMVEHEKNIYSAALPASKVGDTLFYYIQAVDETHHYDGSEKEPHMVIVRAPDSPKPMIQHTDVLKARAGVDVPIHVKVKTPLKSEAVRLYYRHLDQSEDWNIVEMRNRSGSEYESVIPGEFIVPTWDIMYAIEAVDISGTGSFYPDFNGRQPFVVSRVEPR